MKTVKGLKTSLEFLCTDRVQEFGRVSDDILDRTEQTLGKRLTPKEVVDFILSEVQTHGDHAIQELTKKLDGHKIRKIEISQREISGAYQEISKSLVDAMKTAANRIRTFHEKTVPKSWMETETGYGQTITPMERVGAYIPGGTAVYPSTVLMTAIPAKVAGVQHISMCTPSHDGLSPAPVVLVAADLAGVDQIFQIGGAQAIAAMAFGTETVQAVDMICGPGNIFVTLAKRQLFGQVGIDGLYGPTETVIIADDTANPTLCAADLLAQAEHDPLARAVLITDSEGIADDVKTEIDLRLHRLDRAGIIQASLDNHGCISIVDNIDEALYLSNRFAPEHLSLMVKNPERHLDKVCNAGAIFLGDYSHEVLGDYIAGPSHVMPTGGTARFTSGLGVHSFVKISPVIALDKNVAIDLGKAAGQIARSEGLTAHAESAEIREELA